jgi:hypothetical protein
MKNVAAANDDGDLHTRGVEVEHLVADMFESFRIEAEVAIPGYGTTAQFKQDSLISHAKKELHCWKDDQIVRCVPLS